jgi:hypothetical protein
VARNGIGGAVLCGLMLASAASWAQVTEGLVLNGVSIVDTHDGKVARNRAIVIDDGKITQIARADSVTVTGSAKLVNARGAFVVPGYLDMHVHSMQAPNPQASYALMLANGITGFRQMSGSPELLQQRKAGQALPVEAPELLAMPGTILTGLNAGSPEAAVAEVRRQKDMGADFIKVIDVKPDAFFAALDESKSLGLPFDGHLPPSVNVVEASQRGMRGIEHLGPKESVLLGCSTEEEALRREIAQTPPRAPQIVPGPVSANLALRAVANPIMASDPVEFTIMQRVVASYSDAKCRKLAATFVANGTWQVPTLIRLRTMEFGDDPLYRNDPNLRFVAAPIRRLWEDLAQQFPSKVPPDVRSMLKQFFVLQLKLVKLFQATGVPMLAGTDAGGAGQWDISGFALHQEFDLLRQAGLAPLVILQMTTVNGAKFLGREASMGSVAIGKDANLVVLDGNPVASERNLHRIRAVVRGGTYYSKDDLERMKSGAMPHANPSP